MRDDECWSHQQWAEDDLVVRGGGIYGSRWWDLVVRDGGRVVLGKI